jgi:hypothetical protein
MNRKTMLPVDTAMIKARMKELGYTYQSIESKSQDEITEISLKHFLNKGTRADEVTLDNLANLLKCSINTIIDKEYLLSTNLSSEINLLVGKLYLRNREDINQFYAIKIREFRNHHDLKKILEEAHRLFIVISEDDFIFDKKSFVNAFNIIGKDFAADNCISSMDITNIQGDVAKSLFSKIIDSSGGYNTRQVILMFLYVFILFEAIFLEEAVASASQLVPERKTEKADQYFQITYKNEKMRNFLINLIIFKDYQFDEPNIVELGIDDTVIEGIALMLASCEKCYRHIHGNFSDSEYINRAVFSAILSKLEKVFETLGIKLPEDIPLVEYFKMTTTRFGFYYNILKAVFRECNPPRKPRNKELEKFKEDLINTEMIKVLFQ